MASLLLVAPELCARKPAGCFRLRAPDQARRLYCSATLASPIRAIMLVRPPSSVANGCCWAEQRLSYSEFIRTLASQDTARLASYSVIVSAGTVLAAIGLGQVGVTGGALFYLLSSTLGLAAFFLLIELIERGREPGADVLAVTREAYGVEDTAEDTSEMRFPIPGTMTTLGITFIGCAALIAGLPPLSGFVAKFALLTAALNSAGERPWPGRHLAFPDLADPVRTGGVDRTHSCGGTRVLGLTGA